MGGWFAVIVSGVIKHSWLCKDVANCLYKSEFTAKLKAISSPTSLNLWGS